MSTKIKKQNYTSQFIQAAHVDADLPSDSQRKKAWESFISVGFPKAKSEEYKFTPITSVLEKNFESSELLTQSPATESGFQDKLASPLDAYQVVFSNGQFVASASTLPASGQLTIKPLHEALQSHRDLIANTFAHQATNKDPFALFNESFWRDGLFIHVAKNSHPDKPILIYHHHDAKDRKVASHTRLFILVEKSASLSVIEKTNSIGEGAIFNTIIEEILVEENASFNYFKLQDDPGKLIQVNNTTIQQHSNSRIDTYTFSLNGKLIRNNLNIIIDGEGCESHFYGLYLTKGDTLVDNHTVVDHRKPNSFSNELYKGLMDDKSKAVFNGKIYVRPHAQKTNAFQSNRNILLSDTATINTKPQLEIWADDVKCSHGCTAGQLDDEALFYLQSRGIPKPTAKAMLLYAFAGEVIDTIKDEKLRTYIDELVSERLHKNF